MDPVSAWNALLGVGTESKDLTLLQVVLRGILMFLVGLVAVRVAKSRFAGKETPFDFLMVIMLGAVLSRAINGSAPLLPTIAAGFVLIGLHAVLARISYHVDWFGRLVKGQAHVVLRDGKPDEDALRRHAVTRNDLEEQLRLAPGVSSLDEVKEARLERNGRISFSKRQ